MLNRTLIASALLIAAHTAIAQQAAPAAPAQPLGFFVTSTGVGKGADLGAVFGGGSSQALFVSAGPADFLNKATRVLVGIFMVTSLTLGYFATSEPTKSVMGSTAAQAPKTK